MTDTNDTDTTDDHHVLGDLSQVETENNQIDCVTIYTDNGKQFVFSDRRKDAETTSMQGIAFSEVHVHGND